MIDLAIVIRLKNYGWMARFDDTGCLVEWVDDVERATTFPSMRAATAAIRGIAAPEIREAIRDGRAYRARDGFGRTHICDSAKRYLEDFPTPPIRLDYGPRFLGDNPAHGTLYGEPERRAERARQLVALLFRDAPRLNWKRQAETRFVPGSVGGVKEHISPEAVKAYRGRNRKAARAERVTTRAERMAAYAHV